MLKGRTVAFVPITDAARALAFYRDVLGLAFTGDDGHALTFESNGTAIRATRVDANTFKPQQFTVLGWQVDNIVDTVRALKRAGAAIERYEFLEQDEDGIWTAPGGASRVAWFSDPDGNVLSIQQ